MVDWHSKEGWSLDLFQGAPLVTNYPIYVLLFLGGGGKEEVRLFKNKILELQISSPTGPYMPAMSPLGRAMDWNLSAWTRLWPLYTRLCYSPGLKIGWTVPLIKPKQFFNAALFTETASACIWSCASCRIGWFHCSILWLSVVTAQYLWPC